MTLGMLLSGCTTTTLPVYSDCPPPHIDPVDHNIQWPLIRFRYPPDPENPPFMREFIANEWHVIYGLPEILNWDFCQTFFENQGLDVIYTNNLIFMKERK